MPLLSIITINYNNAKGLQKTIDSVVNQSFQDFDYVVIDGGSTDESMSIAKTYSRINYSISERDKGVFDAQNKGIDASKGDYLLFLNSGDVLLHNDVLQQVVNLKLKADIWYGDLIFDFGKGKQKLMKLPHKLTKAYLYQGNIWHPATFIKRVLFNQYGKYNLDYKIAADYDFFFKTIAVNQVSAAQIPFPVSLYDTDGISSKSENMNVINHERADIHHSYLEPDEIIYLENLIKFKNSSLAKWLVNKPLATNICNKLLALYSKLRN
jgi:glycosyltransferase involved in cell wall biosynthesis